jgi:hypothetical protein
LQLEYRAAVDGVVQGLRKAEVQNSLDYGLIGPVEEINGEVLNPVVIRQKRGDRIFHLPPGLIKRPG